MRVRSWLIKFMKRLIIKAKKQLYKMSAVYRVSIAIVEFLFCTMVEK